MKTNFGEQYNQKKMLSTTSHVSMSWALSYTSVPTQTIKQYVASWNTSSIDTSRISWWNVITICSKQLINADILVDDGVHNLLGGSYKKILMTASHNKAFDANANGMVRVNNWQEAYDKIIEYADQILAGKTEIAK